MSTELPQIERYIHATLGIEVCPIPWDADKRLPSFLPDRYTFFKLELLEASCLFMVDRGEKEQSPATVRKHMDQVEVKWDGDVVYVRERVTTYNRKRLIKHKVPFVVPGNQMYLPMLGIDLREHFKKLRTKTHKFSPSTQALVIHVLLNRPAAGFTPSEMAQRLGYSAMTMTRAFDELEKADIGAFSLQGRERCLGFAQGLRGKYLWEKALPLMRNPVRKRIRIVPLEIGLPSPRAGLSALAHHSMLAEPHNKVFALSGKRWKLLQQNKQVTELPAQEPGVPEIEVWRYDPDLFANNGVVDCLSLYLSLKEHKDERVEAALAEMMKDIQW